MAKFATWVIVCSAAAFAAPATIRTVASQAQSVLSGELVLVVADLPVRVLGADDSAYYSSELRHSFRNPSTETTVRVICVNSPSNL